jgi:hypothetical protein
MNMMGNKPLLSTKMLVGPTILTLELVVGRNLGGEKKMEIVLLVVECSDGKVNNEDCRSKESKIIYFSRFTYLIMLFWI